MADVLNDYLAQTRRLLHDANANFWSDYDLTAYINEARNHVATDTGALRTLQVPTFQSATEQFVFGGLTSIQVTAGGSNYTAAPTVSFSTGSGATGTATIANAAVSSISVGGGGGSGYLSVPAVTLSGGGGTGASAHAVLANQSVSSIVVDYGGQGYTAAPTVTITARGSGAAATAVITAGAVSGITVNAQGLKYQVAPTVSFSGGGGSGATAVANIIQDDTVDVSNCTLIWNSMRTNVRNMAFTDFSAAFRAWVNYSYLPAAYSVYASSIYIGPYLSTAYAFELDCIMIPEPLLNYTDSGSIPEPFVEPVKYYAAYLAKLNEQGLTAAQAFLQLYLQTTAWALNVYTKRSQQVYYNNANY